MIKVYTFDSLYELAICLFCIYNCDVMCTLNFCVGVVSLKRSTTLHDFSILHIPRCLSEYMLLFMHTSPNNAGNVGQRKYKIEKVKKMRDTYLNKFARVH